VEKVLATSAPPVTQVTYSGGNAWATMRAITFADRAVISDGLSMTWFPAAMRRRRAHCEQELVVPRR
jgi:hypothetical protein